MSEVASSPFTLSDSTFKSRPDIKSLLVPDLPQALRADDSITNHRLTRMRTLGTIPHQKPEAFLPEPNLTQQLNYKRANDEGDWHLQAPGRAYDVTASPVPPAPAPGQDSLTASATQRTATNDAIAEAATKPLDKPQQRSPEERRAEALPPIPTEPGHYQYTGTLATLAEIEPRRLPTYQERWHDRKVADVVVRGKIAAWAAQKVGAIADLEPKIEQQAIYKESVKQEMPDMDKWTLDQFYQSNITRGYREVPYDAMLHSKRVPCPSHESAMRHPDSYNLFEDPERYAVPAQQWRKLYEGRSWDEAQLHEGPLDPHQATYFRTKFPRAQQIPLYSGELGTSARDGAEVLQDPAQSTATPLTVKRSEIPAVSNVRQSPNIPGYTGCFLRYPALSAALPRQETKVFMFR